MTASIAKLIALLTSLVASPVSMAEVEAQLLEAGFVTAEAVEAEPTKRHLAHARRDLRREARATAREARPVHGNRNGNGNGLGRRAPVRPEPGVSVGRNLEARALRATAIERREARQALRAERAETASESMHARRDEMRARRTERRATAMSRGRGAAMRNH